MSEDFKSNPERYRELSEPFADVDTANTAYQAFLEDVSAAREKHRMTDVLIVVSFPINYDSGEGNAIAHNSFGDLTKAEALAAYALGRESADRRELINRLVAGTTRKAKGEI